MRSCSVLVGVSNFSNTALLNALRSTRKFTSRKLVVCDFVNRHLLMAYGMDYFGATEKSEELGKQWIEKNRSILTSTPNLEVIKWVDIFVSKEYESNYLFFIERYFNDSRFRKRIDTCGAKFFEASKLSYSRNYLLETLAGLKTLNQTKIICPGKNPSLSYTMEFLKN